MAINGEGFFAVAKPTSTNGTTPVFGGADLYTRRGDFQLDRDGYLVSGAGYYLKGLDIDSTTGNVTGSLPHVLQFQNDFQPAQVTTGIEYRGNLATYPKTEEADPTVPGSELINPINYWSNPIATVPTPAKVTGHGATVAADAAAVATGGTDISALTSVGGTLTINATPVTIPASNAAAIVAAINGATGTTGVTASLNSSNHLVLTSADADTDITIAGSPTSTLAVLNELGLLAGTTSATNLVSQGKVASGQTLTVQLNSGTPQVITFGYGAGQVSTLADLSAALGGLVGLNATVDSTGNVTLTAQNTTDSITVSGTATLENFGIAAGTALSSNGTVRKIDETTFLSQSVSGGAVTAYDVNGSAVNMQFRWAKSDAAIYGGTDTWHLFYQSNSYATGTQTAWTRVPQIYSFGANGQLNPPLSNVTIPNATVNGVTIGNVTLNHGASGLTQFADTNGTVSVTRLSQDGYPAGDLVDIAVGDNGRIRANYSNGRSGDIALIPIYSFSGANMLKKADGGAFSATAESGTAVEGASGSIVGKTLEGSNTDIADEFTKLIVTQQAYAANTRVVTTANEMLQQVLQMGR
jgi:flagellar hook protein FlgE